jgi:hypothetical protein
MSTLPPPQASPPGRPPGQVLPPAPVLRPPGSRWPVAVGYVSVGIAGIFLAMAVLALADPGGQILKLIPQFARFQPKMPAWMTSWQIASSVLSTVTYGTLLLAGLALTKRRRRARPLHFCYAALGVALAAFGFAFQLKLGAEMPMPAGMGPMPVEFQGMMRGFSVFAAILGLPVALAYPTFVTIWFLRRKIAAEVRSWGPRP